MYYLFLFEEYGNNVAEYLMLYLKIRRELDTKKRKIRSIRGFLLYIIFP